MTTTRRISLVALFCGFVGLAYLLWMLWPTREVRSQVTFDPRVDARVLAGLGPGTTLHTVTIIYRRYGDAASQIAAAGTQLPEWTKHETWLTFGDDGAVTAYRGEVRGAADGVLYATAGLEDGALVSWNPDGTKRVGEDMPGFAESAALDSVKRSLEQAYLATFAAVTTETARAGMVASRPLLIIEKEGPVTRTPQTAGGDGNVIGYRIPYVDDLNPVSEIRRSYIDVDEYFEVKSEVAVVDEDGAETIVESHERVVLEVIPDEQG